ncbi:cupin [Halostreptopolyspora alba]|uniref:Cupin n=1 Tax=Halostreptopolyspora alba TaxID=2487137 RepID=A0A3N0EHC0_9ACTN|nr:cupin [Nocardiopsaceae bacterium YIM 96095]
MTFDPTTTARFTAADASLWSWSDDAAGTHVGYIADAEEGAAMGMAFVRFGKGVTFDFTWPYDEVCVVTRGSLSVRTGGRLVTAREGELMTQPRGVPGTFEITEDLEMICVHHPTFAEAHDLTLREYRAMTDAGNPPDAPPSVPRQPRVGRVFDPSTMQTFTLADVPEWTCVDERGGAVGYLADRAEGSPMGLAFSVFPRGGVYEFALPYDQVAAVTAGRFTVRGQEGSFTVRAGEMLYVPREVPAVFEIAQDTVAVAAHHPTYQEATGTAPHRG